MSKKSNLFRVSLWILNILSFCATAQVEKGWSRAFEVDESTTIHFKNSFGKVHVATWAQPIVQIDAEITVLSNRGRRATEILDNVRIIFEQEENKLRVFSDIDLPTHQQESYEIDIDIKAPSKNVLQVENTFGDVFIDSREGWTQLRLSYGDLKAGDLKGGGSLNLSFGKGEVGYLERGKVNLKYSDYFSILSGEDLSIRSEFSQLEVQEAKHLDLDCKYGSIEMGSINHVVGDVQYTHVEIEYLNRSLGMRCKHASNFEIGEISRDFEKVDIEGDFGSYKIDLEEGLSAEFEGIFRYSDMRVMGVDIEYTERFREDNRNEYRAFIGKPGSSSKIRIRSDYGDLRLTQ